MLDVGTRMRRLRRVGHGSVRPPKATQKQESTRATSWTGSIYLLLYFALGKFSRVIHVRLCDALESQSVGSRRSHLMYMNAIAPSHSTHMSPTQTHESAIHALMGPFHMGSHRQHSSIQHLPLPFPPLSFAAHFLRPLHGFLPFPPPAPLPAAGGASGTLGLLKKA